MAWRIHDAVIRGEIDNRNKGEVTGTIWLRGRADPVELRLQGNPWRDLAGMKLKFSNPNPAEDVPEGLAVIQAGKTGDITASRKVKVPDCSTGELMDHIKNRTSFPWHWGNALYLEWYSATNGRVVIESSDYHLEVEGAAAWTMSEEEEHERQERNQEHLGGFMQDLSRVLEFSGEVRALEDEDADAPPEELEAQAHHDKMNLLFDRTRARMVAEGIDDDFESWERIYEEEREKLRIERGEPPPRKLTPEELEDQEEWIEEMNRICGEAMEEWENQPPAEPEKHPLQERSQELALKVSKDMKESAWIPKDAGQEHPLEELRAGLFCASAKLSGALGHHVGRAWPPPDYAAGDTLYRLKKARDHLRDSLLGLDAADEENLGSAPWRQAVRQEIEDILRAVLILIREVRESLQ